MLFSKILIENTKKNSVIPIFILGLVGFSTFVSAHLQSFFLILLVLCLAVFSIHFLLKNPNGCWVAFLFIFLLDRSFFEPLPFALTKLALACLAWLCTRNLWKTLAPSPDRQKFEVWLWINAFYLVFSFSLGRQEISGLFLLIIYTSSLILYYTLTRIRWRSLKKMAFHCLIFFGIATFVIALIQSLTLIFPILQHWFFFLVPHELSMNNMDLFRFGQIDLATPYRFRMPSIFYHPNQFGFFSASIFCFFIFFPPAAKKLTQRFRFLFLLILLGSILLSQCRNAGLICFFALVIQFVKMRAPWMKKMSWLLIFLCAALFSWFHVPMVRQKVEARLNHTILSGRDILWQKSLSHIGESWFLGHGLETSGNVLTEFEGPMTLDIFYSILGNVRLYGTSLSSSYGPHNFFLALLMDMGILGLFFQGMLFFSLLRIAKRTAFHHPHKFYRGFGKAFLAFLSAQLFVSIFESYIFLFFIYTTAIPLILMLSMTQHSKISSHKTMKRDSYVP